MMRRPCDYDDGLDADGYPIEPDPEPVDDGFTPTRLPCVLDMERLAFAARLSRSTESPIETMMGLALHECFVGIDHVEIIPQMPWRRYRIDWVVRRPGRPDIFIECDGHEFHSAPADVARDRARDAEALGAGNVVMRFTGSEIYQDPTVCALAVLEKAIA